MNFFIDIIQLENRYPPNPYITKLINTNAKAVWFFLLQHVLCFIHRVEMIFILSTQAI